MTTTANIVSAPPLTKSAILHGLRTRLLGKEMRLLESIDSTNSYAKQLLREGTLNGVLVATEEQTDGRGRLGRAWHSEKSANLTFSLILKNIAVDESLGLVPIAVGVAVVESIGASTRLKPECKWPNDILIDGKKVCGILCESIPENSKSVSVIIGIGVNVNQKQFPPEIEHSATSLSIAAQREFDRAEILSSILNRLEPYIDLLSGGNPANILTRWRRYAPMLGKPVTLDQNGAILQGIAKDIDNDGSLIVETNGKTLHVVAGDVTIEKNL
jgi:BirA family biotin operon repressor/biotin-[acetyl-CoA-carboxylase] ligase